MRRAFGADALWAIVGLLIGNLVGGVVMALHAAQGPRLGLPQMISSAQFGVYGAIVPLVLVVLLHLGFAATGTVLAGQAIDAVLGGTAPVVGIVLFGLLTAVVAVVGYRWIHAMGRIATVVGILGFTYLMVRLLSEYGLSSLVLQKPFDAATVVLAISLGAGWQLTFGPYVADYSRYLPRETPERTTFAATLAGSVIGSQWSMSLGALVAAVPASTFLTSQVGFLGDLAGGGAAALAIFLVIVVGKLTVNCRNAYGGFMSLLTTVTSASGRDSVARTTRAVFIGGFVLVSVLIALLASSDFLNSFTNFVLALLLVFTPWSAINLIDYYVISKERVDVPALYDPDGRYGRWNALALGTYAIGIAVQIPFMAQTLYTGWFADALGGADLSWLIGLVVTAAIYYPLARRTTVVPV